MVLLFVSDRSASYLHRPLKLSAFLTTFVIWHWASESCSPCGPDASYVAGEVENDTKKPKVRLAVYLAQNPGKGTMLTQNLTSQGPKPSTQTLVAVTLPAEAPPAEVHLTGPQTRMLIAGASKQSHF